MARSGVGAQREDPRTTATRASLVEAFVALGQAGDRPVTVAELAARAGVHRSSFYAHFRGVDDVAALAVRRQLEEIHADNLRRHLDGTMAEEQSNAFVLAQILDRGRTAAAPLMATLNHDRAVAEQALGGALRDFVLDYYRRVPAYSAMTARRLAVSADFVGHALSALVCAWLAGEVPVSQRELVHHLSLLVPAWVMRPELVAATPV